MERQPLGQLQAVNLFETEEVCGLENMKKKPKTQQWAIPSLCGKVASTTASSLPPASAQDLTRVVRKEPNTRRHDGHKYGQLTGRQRQLRCPPATEPPPMLQSLEEPMGPWDCSCREPLGSHYPGHAQPRPTVTQEVSMRTDWPHVPSTGGVWE